jgi:hypothetical protein
MPDTLFSLGVLILLGMPGVIFAIQLENRQPAREVSPLRELATIVSVGIVCDALALVVFGIIRAIRPSLTPDVGRIERSGMQYVKSHFASVGWWSIALLLTACAVAYILGRFRPQMAKSISLPAIKSTSAWWEAFHQYPDAYVYVGCVLQDDSYLAGYLKSYSTDVNETPDRDLILCAPITYRSAGGDEEREMEDVGLVTVSASQLKFFTVTYMYSDPQLNGGATVTSSNEGASLLQGDV